jgi:CRISPR-associated protein Csx17
MTEANHLILAGCAPMPLASYLKALGVLRLVCEQGADPDARGWWSGESFHLRTRLDRDALLRSFLEDYRPSPIVAPWNGGSGFYPGDNRDGFAPLLESAAPRFQPIREIMAACAGVVNAAGLTARPEPGDEKRDFVARLRATLPDEALPWIDAALALTTDGLRS